MTKKMAPPATQTQQYSTPVTSPNNNASIKKESASFLNGINGVSGSSNNVANGINGAASAASNVVENLKESTAHFFQTHIKPNLALPEDVASLQHLNRFTAAVREQIAHMDAAEIKEKYADLANNYYRLLLETYQAQIESVHKHGGWKAVPLRSLQTAKSASGAIAGRIATEAQQKPFFGVFALAVAALAALPLAFYAAFSALTVLGSLGLASAGIALALGAAGIIFGATLLGCVVIAAIFAGALRAGAIAFDRTKTGLSKLGAYAHREEEAARIVGVAEKAEKWVKANYKAVEQKTFGSVETKKSN